MHSKNIFNFPLLVCAITMTHAACSDNKNISDGGSQNGANPIERDSIYISIKLPRQTHTGFNVFHELLNTHFYSFENPTNRDTTITRKIAATNQDQVIFNSYVTKKNGKIQQAQQSFLLLKEFNEFQFNFKEDKTLELVGQGKNGFKVMDSSLVYSSLLQEIENDSVSNNKYLLAKLDSIYNKYHGQNNPTQDWKKLYLKKINDLQYFVIRQTLSPYDNQITNFINKIEDPVIGIDFVTLMYKYAEKFIEEELATSLKYPKTGIVFH